MKSIALSTFAIMISLYSFSQENETPDIITDRPDQSESTAIVPLNMLQIETGFVYEHDKTDLAEFNNTTFNTTLFRYGLFKSTELRIGMEYLESIRKELSGGEYSAKGFGALHTGVKVKITQEKGLIPEMAILGSLDWPATANKNLKPSYVAPSLRLAFDHTLTEYIGLAYNLAAEWDGETPVASYFYSVSLGIDVTRQFGAFIEAFGSLYEDYKPENKIDGGFTYMVDKNFLIDLYGGLGLSEASPDYFIGFGLSYRIPE